MEVSHQTSTFSCSVFIEFSASFDDAWARSQRGHYGVSEDVFDHTKAASPSATAKSSRKTSIVTPNPNTTTSGDDEWQVMSFPSVEPPPPPAPVQQPMVFPSNVSSAEQLSIENKDQPIMTARASGSFSYDTSFFDALTAGPTTQTAKNVPAQSAMNAFALPPPPGGPKPNRMSLPAKMNKSSPATTAPMLNTVFTSSLFPPATTGIQTPSASQGSDFDPLSMLSNLTAPPRKSMQQDRLQKLVASAYARGGASSSPSSPTTSMEDDGLPKEVQELIDALPDYSMFLTSEITFPKRMLNK